MSSINGRSFPDFNDDDVPARRALRALQIADECMPIDVYADNPRSRPMVMELQGQLGMKLGLTCSGVYEGGGIYDHSGDTCPIHEWLVLADGPVEQAEAASG